VVASRGAARVLALRSARMRVVICMFLLLLL
jgi:hypothetical protein